MEPETIVIGIDLGTSNSAVAYYDEKNDAVISIKNTSGSQTTPSIVAFTQNGEQLVGEAAKSQMASNTANTIFGMKRLIGLNFDEPSVQEDIKHWPFKIVEGKADSDMKGKPLIEITRNGEVAQVKPEDISTIVLQHMKSLAESHFKQPVTNAVITVPAYFSQAQRTATHEAAVKANLNVLEMINEPTAAALAYGLDNLSTANRNVLVFDFGGGTLDVAVLNIQGTTFEVKAAQGDLHLGGDDIDNCLVKHLMEDFYIQHLADLSNDDRAKRILGTAAEKAKRTLSSAANTVIELEGLSEQNIDFTCKISREEFENMIKVLLDRILVPVEKAISVANLSTELIDEVVLVGGSTRIPKVQALLSEFFGGKQLKQNVDADVAVAQGAAIRAAKLNKAKVSEIIANLALTDIATHSLGIEINTNDMNVLIPKNTRLPVKVTRMYTNQIANQTTYKIPVFAGEEKKTDQNNLLGEFTLSEIPPFPLKQAQIEVTMEVDSSGILHITAVETSTKTAKKLEITQTA